MRSNRDRTDQPTLEAIAEAALAVVDDEGPEALSFRRVAQSLGVSHATVFRRCGDFDGLVNACADRLAARMPRVGQDLDWATATEARFSAFYEVLIEHPGLVALRSGRAWWGPHLLSRLVEPQLAHSIAAGMAPEAAIRVYRRLYLLTLGAVAFVDHRDAKKVRSAARTALAALDPEEFPALTGNLGVVVPALTDHEVYRGALRQLIDTSTAACAGR
ncbi:TetR/AcrR family transcriptional regulator [Streptomyces sp. NPDC056697]|uniref:TetR/AcrR family transcriptional regulator n=1 Tax=Streptomyces sp. NPDC056697 TaxID=3345915 RepID=UPI0036BD5ED8